MKSRARTKTKLHKHLKRKASSTPNRGPHLEKKNTVEREIKDLETRIALESPTPGLYSCPDHDDANGGEQTGPSLTVRLFSDLPLSSRTLGALKRCNFLQLTPIQGLTIPHALAGRDVLGEAETGSGKTLAFLVPLLENLYRLRWNRSLGLGALIITPTRELATQIFDVLRDIGCFHDFSAACLIGGRFITQETKHVDLMNIVVSTPGRLLQHLDESPGFSTANLQILVVDEADQLVDLGFSETMQNILDHLPVASFRQTMLFSATLASSVRRLASISLKENPERISARLLNSSQTSLVPTRLKQNYVEVGLENQMNFLFSFLRNHSRQKSIVFVNSCKQVRFLYEAFRRLKPGAPLFEVHGRQSQQKRLDVFQTFSKKTESAILICTDIAARGIDFPAVDWVIQVNCPPNVETYIHRIGRTARYHNSGKAVLFLLPSESKFLERLKEKKIEPARLLVNPKKVVSITPKLSSVVAGNHEIRHLAEKSLISFLRSVLLARDKEIFNVRKMLELPDVTSSSKILNEFALSLGLAVVPSISDIVGDSTLELKKKKTSKLERLRQKILEKRAQQKQQEHSTAVASDDWEMSDSDGEKEKLSKQGRRQKKLRELRQNSGNQAINDQEDVDEILEKVKNGESPQVLETKETVDLTSLDTKRKLRKQNIRIRADGTAKIKGLAALAHKISSQHLFFDEDSDKEITNLKPRTDFEHYISELKKNGDLTNKTSINQDMTPLEVQREQYLLEIKERLDRSRDADKARDKERVQQKHVKKRERQRHERQEAAKGATIEAPRLTLESLDIEQTSDSDIESSLDDGPRKKRTLGSEHDLTGASLERLEEAALNLVAF